MMQSMLLPVKIDKGQGEPIVLLHGLGNNHKSWLYVLDNVDYRKNRVIALDLLGFGDAPKPQNQRYTKERHADAVAATLRKMGVHKAHVVGHSMGAIVAVELASSHEGLVSRLTLLGAPIYKRRSRDTWWPRVFRSEGIYFHIFSIVKKNPDAVQTGGKIADELIPFVKGMEITEETWPAYKSSLEYTVMQTDTFRQVCGLRIPTLLVNGIFDMFIIHRHNISFQWRNRRYVRQKVAFGPHELTPRQGRKIARIIQSR